MSGVSSAAGPIHLGMDTSKNTIVVGVLMPGEEVPVIDRVWNEEGPVRHLIGRFGDPAELRCCYEAGPCGFELHRLRSSMGVACDEVAPSLIPRRAGERVKTDKRDASRLARLHRAGVLTAIRVPSLAEEAVRDLVRARAALLADRKRAQQRITAMLLRHGRVWRSGSYWTLAHEQWIAGGRPVTLASPSGRGSAGQARGPRTGAPPGPASRGTAARAQAGGNSSRKSAGKSAGKSSCSQRLDGVTLRLTGGAVIAPPPGIGHRSKTGCARDKNGPA
jgi:hypothetical protein